MSLTRCVINVENAARFAAAEIKRVMISWDVRLIVSAVLARQKPFAGSSFFLQREREEEMMMRRFRTGRPSIVMAIMVCVTGMPLIASHAQTTPLNINMEEPCVDEWSERLEGTDPLCYLFGITPVVGDLVQVLQADEPVRAPDAQGHPHPDNPLLYTTRIGIGISPDQSNSGRFGAALLERPRGMIVVRIFNAPSLEEASFYADSQVFTVSGNVVFDPIVPRTDVPLDDADDDGDGLHNSWEKSYGSDPLNPDSDGDGIMDGAEHLAGTSPIDGNALLSMVRIQVQAGALSIEWDTVPGKTYQPEFHALDVGPESFSYQPIGPAMTATDGRMRMGVPTESMTGAACYRIRLVVE